MWFVQVRATDTQCDWSGSAGHETIGLVTTLGPAGITSIGALVRYALAA